MSGGSHNYICYKIEDELYGQMCDDELNDLIEDIIHLTHDLEWWNSGDISKEQYMKTVLLFKKKWLKSTDRNVRIKGYIDKKFEELKNYFNLLLPNEDEVLLDKHWEECRQIALYDDELRQTVGALRRAIELLSNASVYNDDFDRIERLSNEMWDKIYKKHEITNNLESKNEE